MLTYGHLAMMTAFISMFCVFVTAPHSCGAFVLPLYGYAIPERDLHDNIELIEKHLFERSESKSLSRGKGFRDRVTS